MTTDAALDPDSPVDDPKMSIASSATEVTIEVPDRFTLGFQEVQNWHPSLWMQEDRDATDLSGESTLPDRTNIQTPLILCALDACVGVNEATDETLVVVEELDSSVVLLTEWKWNLSGQALSGSAMYTIAVDGSWTTSATLTHDGDTPFSGNVEMADSHVNTTLPWRQTSAAAGDFYAFSLLATDDEPAVNFAVQYDGTDAVTLANDEEFNCYFVKDFTIAPAQTLTFEWSATLL